MKVQILGALAATALLAAGCQDDARRARDARAEEARTIEHAEHRKAEIDRDAMNKKADLTRDEVRAQRDAADKLAQARVAEVDRTRHPADENDTTLRNRDLRERDVGEVRDREVGTARSGGVYSAPVESAELSIVGIVKDAGHDTLKVVTRNKGELAVKTDDATRVLRHGMRVKLNDIREGAEVRVSYRYDGKQNKADRIEVERDLR